MQSPTKTAFEYYTDTNFLPVRTTFTNARVPRSEVMMRLAEQWRTMSQAERDIYENMAHPRRQPTKTSFEYFADDNRRNVRALFTNTKVPVSDINMELIRRWRNLSPAERQRYEDMM